MSPHRSSATRCRIVSPFSAKAHRLWSPHGPRTVIVAPSARRTRLIIPSAATAAAAPMGADRARSGAEVKPRNGSSANSAYPTQRFPTVCPRRRCHGMTGTGDGIPAVGWIPPGTEMDRKAIRAGSEEEGRIDEDRVVRRPAPQARLDD